MRLDAVPEELGVPRRRRPHHRVGVQIVGHSRLIGIARPELHDAPVHFGDILVADLPDDVLVDEIALAQRGLLRPDHVGEFGADADLFARAQIAVIGLLAVGGDHTDIAGLVEQFDDPGQRVVVGANSAQPHHRPHLDHRRRRDDAGMAGGPGRGLVDVDRVAVADRLHPVVDHRLVHRIAADPRLAPARRLDLLDGLLETASSRHPRHLQTRRRDHLPHHLVHAAAEGDDEVALGLLVQPEQQLGGLGLGGVAVLADDLLGQPAHR